MDTGSTEVFRWKAGDVAREVGGRLLSGNSETCFDGVSIDSRNITGNDLFVAIKGVRHDGHDFVPDVIEKGAKGVVVEHARARETVRFINERGIACIGVEDTTRALGLLARYRRREIGPTVVAITGTSGKTTTREMTAAVCRRDFYTLATAGNFNNQIGLPLTLLRLVPGHKVAVVELGTNSVGEIETLSGICEPDIGVVLNVGPGHLEGLGTVEGVAREKEALVEALDSANGVAVLNVDDPSVRAMAARAKCRVVGYGFSEEADVRAVSVKKERLRVKFELFFKHSGDKMNVILPCAGIFMVSNALAAAAVGSVLGIPVSAIKTALEDFAGIAGRMVVIPTKAGFTVVDDSYNANPVSVAAAISGLVGLKGNDRGIVVLGDMLELGDQAVLMHGKTGAMAAESGVDMICATGDFAGAVAEGAISAGMAPEKIVTGSKEEILKHLRSAVVQGDWILVKGSRGMSMETVVSELVTFGGGACYEREEG